MKYSMKIEKDMACAWGTFPISYKHALVVARKINRKRLPIAKKFLDAIVAKKMSINGKYYTNACKKIINLIKNVETNATAKNLDPLEMMLFISVNKGPTMYRSRRKREYGLRLRRTNMQAILKPIKSEKNKSDQ
ncbi:MAG: hypothetical protein J7K26_04315 [Candidatus Aenigmarchaeota archaeon]|nr:hypothetical protein [Candidatus Aenigmarchaeota archaeon]